MIEDDFDELDDATQTAVLVVVINCRKMPGRHSMEHRGGEVYAYPGAGGKIAWGVNSASDGMNIARGLMDR